MAHSTIQWARGNIYAVGFGLLLAVAALALYTVDAEAEPLGNDNVCEHANSKSPCREDPQPEHGKDCESHAANIDGNEDHCLVLQATEPPTEPPEVHPSATPPPTSSKGLTETEAPKAETTPTATATPFNEVSFLPPPAGDSGLLANRSTAILGFLVVVFSVGLIVARGAVDAD